jgi:hypothetical protein
MVNLCYVSALLWTTALAAYFVPAGAKGNSYNLDDEIIGPQFYRAFDWQDMADPTHGRVYVVPNLSEDFSG